MEQQEDSSRTCPAGDWMRVAFDPSLEAEWQVQVEPCKVCSGLQVEATVSYLSQEMTDRLQSLLAVLVKVGER